MIGKNSNIYSNIRIFERSRDPHGSRNRRKFPNIELHMLFGFLVFLDDKVFRV